MKRTRISGLLALVLAVVMLLTLVGCGDKADAPKKSDSDKKTTVTTTTTTTAAEPDGTTTGTDAADTTTVGTEAPTTTVVAPTNATTKPTKKPTTTTTTVKTTVPPVDPDHVFEDVPDALDGQKIKMFIWWEATPDDLKQATYYNSRTGIQVAFETSAVDKYQSNLSGKILAGSPPHTAAIRSEWFPLPITRGLMQPIKNTGWDYSNKKDDIYALSMMDQFSYKGERYGVALKGSRMPSYQVMFFNKDFLKRKGVEEDPYTLWKKGEWNWDTCLSIAKACTDAKKEQYGLTNMEQHYWLMSAGQDFVLSEATGLKNNVKSPEVLEAWHHDWDMIYTHKVIPTNFSQQKELFYAGHTAMLGAPSAFMQTAAGKSGYVPQNADFEWGVVPFPSPAGMSAVSGCEGVVWGFPTKVSGDKMQAAMWWLRYYLDDSGYDRRDVYANEESWEVLQWMSSQKAQSYNSVGVVCYGGKYTRWSIWYSVIDESTKASLKIQLEKWYNEIEKNIAAIESGL